MSEDRATRLKRLKIRAWRRGIKEMDLVIGGYADARLHEMTDQELDLFETIMAENDQDLLSWCTGQEAAPARFEAMLQDMIARTAPAK